jgi:hypothetical protein
MSHLRSLFRTLKPAVLALACWAAACVAALAQAPAEPSGGEGGATDYTLAYTVVILGVALGLLVVLRASTRREREKPEGYVQKTVLRED